MKELLTERLATLKEFASQTDKWVRIDPNASPAERNTAYRAVYQVELELCDADNEHIAGLEKWLALSQEWEKLSEDLYKAGQIVSRDVRCTEGQGGAVGS